MVGYLDIKSERPVVRKLRLASIFGPLRHFILAHPK
jgi:hypothetical protein